MTKLSEVKLKEYAPDEHPRAYYQVTEGEVDLQPDALSTFLESVVDGRDDECDYCGVSGSEQTLAVSGESESTDRMPHPDADVFYLDAVSLTCVECPSDGPGVPAPSEDGLFGLTGDDDVSAETDQTVSSSDSLDSGSRGRVDDTGSSFGGNQAPETADTEHSPTRPEQTDSQSELNPADEKNVVVRDDGVPIYPDEGRIAFDLMGPDKPGGSEEGLAPGRRSAETGSESGSASATLESPLSPSAQSSSSNSVTTSDSHPLLGFLGGILSEMRILCLGFVSGLLVPGWIGAVTLSREWQRHRTTLVRLGAVGGLGLAGAGVIILDLPGLGGSNVTGAVGRPSDIGAYGVAFLGGIVYVSVVWGSWGLQSGTAIPSGVPSDIPSLQTNLLRRLGVMVLAALGLILLAAGSYITSLPVIQSEAAIAVIAAGTACYLVTGLTVHRALVAVGPRVPRLFGVNIAFYRAIGHVLTVVCPWLWVTASTLSGRVVTILLPVVYYAGVLRLLRS